MNKDSGFDDKEFTVTPYLKLIERKKGGTCLCYQMRLHGKLHFVKKIRPEFENDARMRAAFRKENELGYSLSHPNFPRYVFMDGIFSPEEYVVTEWIDGETLDKFIENHSKYFSDRKNIVRFIYQLTDALDYLHQNGIIHGDLKPSNIMLSRDGEKAILLDLGYSTSDAYVLTGGYTYDFAAPELIKGESTTTAADYYSLGKIIGFIENHTEGKLPKEILGLKKALTHYDISGRIQTKEEVDEISKKKSGKWVWFTGLVFLGLLVWLIVADVNKERQEGDDRDKYTTLTKEKTYDVQSSPQDIETFQTQEPVPPKNDINLPIDQRETDNSQIEFEKNQVKAEVNRLLKLNYAPFIDRIDSLTQANVFTKDWYFKIINESAEAMGNSIKDSYYYERYPSVPKEEVIYILSTEFDGFTKEIWLPKLKNYQENIPH